MAGRFDELLAGVAGLVGLDAKAQLLLAYEALEEEREANGGLLFDRKKWNALKAVCAKHGLRPCHSPVCDSKILGFCLTDVKPSFGKDAKSGDGIRTTCRDCTTPVKKKQAAAARDAMRERRNRLLAARPEPKSAGAVEDRAVAWLKAEHLPRLKVMPEFRRADALLPEAEDTFFRIQAKTSEEKGRQANFSQCRGYGSGLDKHDAQIDEATRQKNRCVMVLVHTTSAGERMVWVLDGREVPSDIMYANTSTAILCPKTLKLRCLDLTEPNAVEEAVRRVADRGIGHPRVTYGQAFWDVPSRKQLTEAALMRAMEQTNRTVRFDEGYQSHADFHMIGWRWQAKTCELTGKVSLFARCKGKAQMPYFHDAGFDYVLGGCILKSGDRFFVLYCCIPKRVLIKGGKIVDEEGKGGRTKFTVPLCPTLAPWLVGDEYKNNGVPEYLNSIACGWRVKRIYPTARLPLEVLDRAAKLVFDPSREPSEEWIQNARQLRLDDLKEQRLTGGKKRRREGVV